MFSTGTSFKYVFMFLMYNFTYFFIAGTLATASNSSKFSPEKLRRVRAEKKIGDRKSVNGR